MGGFIRIGLMNNERRNTMLKRILAFDIGIKNLAWCSADISDCSGSARKICVKGWANENLITGGTAEVDAVAGRCATCSHKAAYWHLSSGKGYCSRHCPPLTPALRDLSGNLLKKLPKVDVLKELARRMDATKADLKTKTSTLAFLNTRLCFPKQPAKKVKGVDLEDIHDGIQAVVEKNRELFMTCTEILLENQPAFKNPVMKSVQMMLFATIRDICRPNTPKVSLVHAGRKTVGATKGDEGYAERKGVSEARVLEGLRSGMITIGIPGRGLGWFGEQAKKSDLADCCCMVMDRGMPPLSPLSPIVNDVKELLAIGQ